MQQPDFNDPIYNFYWNNISNQNGKYLIYFQSFKVYSLLHFFMLKRLVFKMFESLPKDIFSNERCSSICS